MSTMAESENQNLESTQTPKIKETFRLDYKPPSFNFDSVFLNFQLDPVATKVQSKIVVRRRQTAPNDDLILDGQNLTLESFRLNGVKLEQGADGYNFNEDNKLVIPSYLLPQSANSSFVIETDVKINPSENLALSGLYVSGQFYSTQCEAEGFRRITYFLDRPDVMSIYTVRIEGDKNHDSIMLSNGNIVEKGDVEGNPDRHYAIFNDPFKKPCYLFALVAGNMESIKDTFVTKSGRSVHLEIFSEPDDVTKLDWAMTSLKKAMKWDEDVFGLEYDLDVFYIVCMKDFNMGAMENKGLNIFNVSLLLADPKTTTDSEYETIASVVAHEYFHNWTGNRVTCRDWFQLTLKEGLTVYRDQRFSMEMFSDLVNRINDVSYLRTSQFNQDSGPLVHPIRPDSYIVMDNFYTSTVYNKGAEVVRMYEIILGKEGFRKGMDLYFKRHDGSAVTCEDFQNAMADANNYDLTQFGRWYGQAGTPVVKVEKTEYDSSKSTFTITVSQKTPPTPKQDEKLPFHIPIKLGLLGKHSKKDLIDPNYVLHLKESVQTFVISSVNEEPVVSFLRGFSAPVKVVFEQSNKDLAIIRDYDSDSFNKWDATQILATKVLIDRVNKIKDIIDVKQKIEFENLSKDFLSGFLNILEQPNLDMSLKAFSISLPRSKKLYQELDVINPVAVNKALIATIIEISKIYRHKFLELYEKLKSPPGYIETLEYHDISRRSLRNSLLFYITAVDDAESAKFAYNHYKNAQNMTDKLSALYVLCDSTFPERDLAIEDFYNEAQGDDIMLDKWFSVQAGSLREDTLENVIKLQSHPMFNHKNPNRFRSLYFAYASSFQFHRLDGKGYELIADIIISQDKINPQSAASGSTTLIHWKKYHTDFGTQMKKQLERIRDTPGISKDTYEIASKGLL